MNDVELGALVEEVRVGGAGVYAVHTHGVVWRFSAGKGAYQSRSIFLPRPIGEALAREALRREEESLAAEIASEAPEVSDASPYDEADAREELLAGEGALQTVGDTFVPVFDQSDIRAAREGLVGCAAEVGDRLRALLKRAQANGGGRSLTAHTSGTISLAGLRSEFPNLCGVMDHFERELALACVGPMAEFRVSPILLVGEPGIGKTAFCRKLAAVLGSGFEALSCAGAQGAFDLAGSSQHWSNATPGTVFRLLAEGSDAAPVLLIDEVDKLGGDDRFPVLPVLLDLCEPDSAKRFKDECLKLRFDASRIIIVMTANALGAVPAPLRSRLEVVEVPPPSAGERRQIARRMLAQLQARSSAPLPKVPDEALDELAALPIDLREVQRRIRRCVGAALAAGGDCVEINVLVGRRASQASIGFVGP